MAATACASGASRTATAPQAAEPLPENRGFAGGTQVRGGFTNRASAIVDSTIAAPPSRVWSAMPGVFERLEIDPETMERASYTIGNPGERVSSIAGSRRLSQYLDCGTGIRGPNADNYEVTLQLLVRLAPSGVDRTVVRTTLDAYARPRDAAGDAIHCASEGTLERQVLALISGELAEAERSAAGESPTGAALAPMSSGRIPSTGDHLRIECLAAGSGESLVGQGRYAGAGNGALRLTVDSRGRAVAVPAVSVRMVQVRERRTYGVVAGIVGFVAGATIGGLYANSRYDPDAKYHFQPAVITTVGIVAGGVGGGLIGRIAGSFIRADTWHDAPAEWALRTSGVDPLQATASPEALCPGF